MDKSKPARKRRSNGVTEQDLLKIPTWVGREVPIEQIAARCGDVAVGSLVVICSKKKISVRASNYTPSGAPVEVRPQYRLKMTKADYTAIRQKAKQLKMSEEALVSWLLEHIARDNMFDAIIDGDDA